MVKAEELIYHYHIVKKEETRTHVMEGNEPQTLICLCKIIRMDNLFILYKLKEWIKPTNQPNDRTPKKVY